MYTIARLIWTPARRLVIKIKSAKKLKSSNTGSKYLVLRFSVLSHIIRDCYEGRCHILVAYNQNKITCDSSSAQQCQQLRDLFEKINDENRLAEGSSVKEVVLNYRHNIAFGREITS